MKKTIAMILSALLLAGMTTATAAFEKDVDYVVADPAEIAMFGDSYPASLAEGWPACTSGELLKGTVIAGGTAELNCADGHSAAYAFDGNTDTFYETFELSHRSYLGLILDQAYELTEVRIKPSKERPTDRLHGLVVQGSNDGETWASILRFRQDAHGNEYHVFTPQTMLNDQAYVDAGYSKRTDVSIFWMAKGGSYSMYRVVNPGQGLQIAFSEIEFYGVAKEATELTPETLAAKIPSLYYYPGNIHVRPETPASVDGNLTGTIIGAGGAWNRALYDLAFDNSNKKAYDSEYIGPDCWVGMMFDEPHALTSVKVQPKRGGGGHMEGAHIQGSLDGINWRTLAVFTLEDVPTKQDFVTKEITDPNGYLYFRYVTTGDNLNAGSMGETEAAEILFYGAPAAAAEPFTVEPTPITSLDKFEGEIYDLGIQNVSVNGSLVGHGIRAGGRYLNRVSCTWEYAMDGDPSTGYSKAENNTYGTECWVGLRMDAPVAAARVSYTPPENGLSSTAGIMIQGSVDSINWTTLAEYGFEDVPTEQIAVEKAVTDETEYTYFRVISNQVRGLNIGEFAIYGDAAPETAAPETAAPETAAPETAAPETAAPETAAPETAAPETAAPETAAPETAAPETAAPETAAPETAAPETAAPETAAPETAAPETAAPETDAPENALDEFLNKLPIDKQTLFGVICVVIALLVVISIIAKRSKNKKKSKKSKKK